MVQEYEDNIIPPPMEFKDNYKLIQAPRTKKMQPVAAPRKINQTRKPLKGFTKSFEISLETDKDPLVQLQNTRKAIDRLFGTILHHTKGFKFVETMKATFIKRRNDKNIYKPAYFNSGTQVIINSNEFLDDLQTS